MRQPKEIVIVTTGDPVASMLERRGPFARMIQDAIGDTWPGGYADFDARKGDFVDPQGAAAFVITGSAANVPTREPWMHPTEAWLREVVACGTPTFGICFGHQILAQALGGEVTRNPRGREIGTARIERRQDDVLFDGLPSSFEANVTHLDTVAKLPPGAVCLARSDGDDHQTIRFTKTCYGVQFHPEIDREILIGYVETRRETLVAEGRDVEALLAGITEARFGAQTLRNFIRHVVRGGA